MDTITNKEQLVKQQINARASLVADARYYKLVANYTEDMWLQEIFNDDQVGKYRKIDRDILGEDTCKRIATVIWSNFLR